MGATLERMTSTPMSLRHTVSTLVAGGAIATYYATPDFITSRALRGWAKAGLGAIMLASCAPPFHRQGKSTPLWIDDETTVEPVEPIGRVEPADSGSLPETFAALSGNKKALLFGASVGAIALTVVSFVVGEKWIFRRGEASAASGQSLPHTRAGLVIGALAAATALLPTTDRGRR